MVLVEFEKESWQESSAMFSKVDIELEDVVCCEISKGLSFSGFTLITLLNFQLRFVWASSFIPSQESGLRSDISLCLHFGFTARFLGLENTKSSGRGFITVSCSFIICLKWSTVFCDGCGIICLITFRSYSTSKIVAFRILSRVASSHATWFQMHLAPKTAQVSDSFREAKLRREWVHSMVRPRVSHDPLHCRAVVRMSVLLKNGNCSSRFLLEMQPIIGCRMISDQLPIPFILLPRGKNGDDDQRICSVVLIESGLWLAIRVRRIALCDGVWDDSSGLSWFYKLF